MTSKGFRVSKAVIPAAGLGTRFLPATKAMPKEMLPIVDKPVIQYVVEEAVAAGLSDLLMITGRNKNTLENHFDRVAELEQVLSQKGDEKKLFSVQASNQLADIHYTRQGDPRGLGHAVLRAKSHVGHNSFAVLLGDDIIDSRDACLTQMLKLHEETGDNVVALMEVPKEQIHLYGVASIGSQDGDVVEVTDLVEKPEADKAPSNLAVIGRYVLRPEMFDILENTQPGRGGEIQLTDALQHAAKHPEIAGGVRGVIFRGRRYDTGDKLDFIKATLRIAVDREDIGDDLRNWLKGFSKEL
ncbi:MAG: UTP--glucose-1-phosphate uridylyltransferase [Actinobacteria bacterium]|jgi:UTP--glucose-1-phosphate uridylyltransferase|nr:UTP--glucose-1-phosphate uridylyltransferase [Actinomycetota bacterium]NCV36485.1 UTP--glucose-1-phosphate uridylyltransferase [Actinomycetota bacterium]NCV80669.1 UTP--glucose-1-phosphate uridylyltransferase [Actinomycetota bacterium]NCV98123.1 UTP--glucose-1-phosphate uridylyltransferase [Actinomycetota bacterium]NCW22591.1 UTP--glucose-1-phosphate uridylyltransferase [Actinomycetota bacterium]